MSFLTHVKVKKAKFYQQCHYKQLKITTEILQECKFHRIQIFCSVITLVCIALYWYWESQCQFNLQLIISVKP